MSGNSGIQQLLTIPIPKVSHVKRLLQETVYGQGLTFYATAAFMLSFFGSRAFALLNPTVTVVTAGIHFHHFWYGLAMVTATGWLGIAYSSQRLLRTYALVFGLGAGLIADEVGLLLTFGDYQSELTTDFFVGAVGFIILATILARYRKVLEKDILHVSWNERLIYLGISFAGLSTLFFAFNIIIPGLVTAGIGFVAILYAFEAAKAGTIAGTGAGAFLAIGSAIAFYLPGGTREEILNTPLDPGSLFTVQELLILALLVEILGGLLLGMIGGAILGLLFSTLHKRILKNYSIKAKALLFGFALWNLGLITGTSDENGPLIAVLNIGLGLAARLSYGYLLGVFFPRFKRRVVDE